MADDDPVTRFIHYADRLDSLMGARTRPAYAETCTCGATVEVGSDVPPAERKRLCNYFVSRHGRCADARIVDADPTTTDGTP